VYPTCLHRVHELLGIVCISNTAGLVKEFSCYIKESLFHFYINSTKCFFSPLMVFAWVSTTLTSLLHILINTSISSAQTFELFFFPSLFSFCRSDFLFIHSFFRSSSSTSDLVGSSRGLYCSLHLHWLIIYRKIFIHVKETIKFLGISSPFL